MTQTMHDPYTDQDNSDTEQYPDGELFGSSDSGPDQEDHAPWGINPKTGRPYTKSPEERAAIGAQLAAARANAAKVLGGGRRRRGGSSRSKVSAPGKLGGSSSAPSSPPKVSTTPDYRATLNGLLIQLPSFALGLAGRADPTFHLDAAAVVVHGPALVDAVAETALSNEQLAALLDRISAVGPWGAVITAGLPLIFQLLCNHRIMPPNAEMGVLGPNELMARLMGDTGAAAAA